MIEFRSTLQSDGDRRAFDVFTSTCGRFGERERRVMPLEVVEVRDSGDPQSAFITKGHAAVYNRKSLDLGGFQEVIDASAFDDVLDAAPDVHLLWDHDTRFALARTMSKRYLLELRSDPKGLHYYARVAPTSFAADLRVLMEGGVIDQASFAFTVAEDTWEEVNRGKDNAYVLRTIHKVDQLYDVTITAMGAYPQTDSQVVRAYAEHHATQLGRLAEPAEEAEEREAISEDAAPEEADVEDNASRSEDEADADPSQSSEGSDGDSSHAEGVGDDSDHRELHPVLKAARFRAKQAVEHHRFLLENTHESH